MSEGGSPSLGGPSGGGVPWRIFGNGNLKSAKWDLAPGGLCDALGRGEELELPAKPFPHSDIPTSWTELRKHLPPEGGGDSADPPISCDIEDQSKLFSESFRPIHHCVLCTQLSS